VSVVRPADVSTRSLVPAGTLEWGIGLAAVLFLGLRLRRHRVGAAILVGLALAAGLYPLYHAGQLWHEREDLGLATQRSSATIVDTTRVVEINLLSNDVENADLNRHRVPQPYDIVQLELRPPGFPGPVTAVDAIDASAASGLASGQQVSVVYPPDDPHVARIEKQTRTHYWQTMRGVYTDYAVYLGAFVVLVLAAHFITRAFRRRTRV
jgi:predicted membrane metal-binding protein